MPGKPAYELTNAAGRPLLTVWRTPQGCTLNIGGASRRGAMITLTADTAEALADALAPGRCDERFMGDAAFGRRFRALMRRNPELLEHWLAGRGTVAKEGGG